MGRPRPGGPLNRSALDAPLALALALARVLFEGSPALAQQNVYENLTGLMWSVVIDEIGEPIATGFTIAGPRLNPNGVGPGSVGSIRGRPSSARPRASR